MCLDMTGSIEFTFGYHCTSDLPTIISGETIGFLDPQEKLWKGQSGMAYKFSEVLKYRGTVAPYDMVCDFSKPFFGTLFRFPLRTEKSALSQNCYTISKLQKLLNVLKKEASFLLVFLRSVSCVEIIEVPSCVQFCVSITNDDKDYRKRIKNMSDEWGSLTTNFQSVRELNVQVVEAGGCTAEYHWLVVEQVGSELPRVLELASQLNVLPWVGTAFGVKRGNIGDGGSMGGRVFCCLPLPEEVYSPLPIHVNGTFGLSDDRRMLKWKSNERQNDVATDWNEVVVSKLLPPCYAKLIQACTLIRTLSASVVYTAWPDVRAFDKSPNWHSLLSPFFNVLCTCNVLWTETLLGGLWANLSEVLIVPEDAPSSTLPAVSEAMKSCDVKLVWAPSHVRVGLEYSRHEMKMLSGAFVRAKLKGFPQTYVGLTRSDKLNLLYYCLSDKSYSEMEGLALLPLANYEFATFSDRLSVDNKLYLCTGKYPLTLFQCFSRIDHVLVDDAFEAELYDLALSKLTQVVLLDYVAVAKLLQLCLPSSSDRYLTCEQFPKGWLEAFWNWLNPHRLQPFADQYLVPVSHPPGCISKLTSLEQSCILYVDEDFDNPELLSSITKLPVGVTNIRDFPYLHHKDIFGYLHRISSASLLKALHNVGTSNLGSTHLDLREAQTIQGFLATLSHISPSDHAVILELPILISTKQLVFSLNTGKHHAWKGTIFVIPEGFPTTCLPSGLLALSATQNYMMPLVKQMPCVYSPSEKDLIMNLLCMVTEKAVVDKELEELMQHVLTYVFSIDEYAAHIRTLPFIRVNSLRELKSPCELYDPSNPDMRKLFFKQPVFPLPPFDQHPYIDKLARCGLRSTVTPKEVADVVRVISLPTSHQPQLTDEVRIVRACAAMNYMTSNVKDFRDVILNLLHGGRSWLAVQPSAPRGYPPCLKWQGTGYESHFVSLTESVIVVKSDTISLIAGSQVYVIRDECAIDLKMFLDLTSQKPCSVKHVLAHFREVIGHQSEMARGTLLHIVHLTYTFLLECYPECGEDLCAFSHPWIWAGELFVPPSMAAMRLGHGFWHTFEPYHYVVPHELHRYEQLFAACGVPSETTDLQLIAVIAKIREGCGKIPELEAWQMIMAIFNHITNGGSKEVRELPEGVVLYAPIESETLQLEDVRLLAYLDNDCSRRLMAISGGSGAPCKVLHSRISARLAACLRVASLSDRVTKDPYAYKIQDVSQHEPLTVRLKNILRDYKDGVPIIKEVIQNADDAEATEVNICYDARTHSVDQSHLFFPGMAATHGPALVVHNNARFSDADFENILKLAGATKMDKPLKIGKFGIGFCSVYHITDVPSFISAEHFIVLDPTGKHLSSPQLPSSSSSWSSSVLSSGPQGKKISLTHEMFKVSKQLDPYIGLYGFNQQTTNYDGTIFRFPFRTVSSEISNNVYNDEMVEKLISAVTAAGEKLLLFLPNIKRITFSMLKGGECEPSLLLELDKTELPLNTTQIRYQIHTSTVYTAYCPSKMTSHWLTSCSKMNVDSAKFAAASVACSLKVEPDSRCLVEPVVGELFCHLPLSSQTGLPVHISSNFAVLNNRIGIWTSVGDASHRGEEESSWNVSLMQTVIPLAYLDLLEALKVLFAQGKLSMYNYYSVWPLQSHLKLQHPWILCLQSMYQSMGTRELLYSEFASKWLSIDKSRFLSPTILCMPGSVGHIPEVEAVARQLNLPLLKLPPEYQEELQKAQQISLFTEEQFLKVFFDNRSNLDMGCQISTLEKMFEMYSASKFNESRVGVLKQYLTKVPCVPCGPNRVTVRLCTDVIDPHATFADLFDVDENRFPIKQFVSNNIIYLAMKDLNMVSGNIPWSMLEERASLIPDLYRVDTQHALKRIEIIVRSAKCNLLSGMKTDDAIRQRLSSIPCFPVMPMPVGYPVKWCGTQALMKGNELLMSSGQKDKSLFSDFSSIAGSQVAIVLTKPPSQGGCGGIPRDVSYLFGFIAMPSMQHVFLQLLLLIKQVSVSTVPTTDATYGDMCSEIYKYLNVCMPLDQAMLLELKCTPCIWVGSRFVLPSHVAEQWSINGPFLFKVPESIAAAPRLKAGLNIKEKFSTSDLVDCLSQISHTYASQPVVGVCQETLRLAISELTRADVSPQGDVMLPSDAFVMHKAKELYYQDDASWPVDKDCTLMHAMVPNRLAVALGVKPVRNQKLEMHYSRFGASPFGQKEELVQRLSNIIREYPFDITLLKELLQNADDAKATRMLIILDSRCHGEKKLPSEAWKDLQGPALLVWNDSAFSDKDIQGIQDLGCGSKRSDYESIGQYGIGFNVVYNITDCPSFVSNGALYVLDPQCKYVPEATPLCPGGRYVLTDDFLTFFEDLKSSYLYANLNSEVPFHSGSLFRFPLRHSVHLVKQSKIIDSATCGTSGHFAEPLTPKIMLDKICEWIPQMKHILHFLNHITELQFCLIDSSSNSINTLHHYKCELCPYSKQEQRKLCDFTTQFSSTSSNPGVVLYPLALQVLDNRGQATSDEQWLIQQGVGDTMSETQRWNFVDRIKPRHGIAAPLNVSTPCEGHVFCFLPLPIRSGLPVHINGQFVLDASRRALWSSTIPNQHDEKTMWNENIFRAISSSYTKLITKITVEDCTSSDELARHISTYYGLFPRWRKCSAAPEGCWLRIAQDVYRKLVRINASVLLEPVLKGPIISTGAHPLEATEKSSQIYFDSVSRVDKGLKVILNRLGMHITCAPQDIREHFSDVGKELPVVSPHTVFAHYTLSEVLGRYFSQLPCEIDQTPFLSVGCFRVFTQYVLQPCPQGSEHKFPLPPYQYPLLLTADSKLRAFSFSDKTLASNYSHLFPNSLCKFLYPGLLDVCYSEEYFLTSGECSFDFINSIVALELHPGLSNVSRVSSADSYITPDFLHSLWQCFSSDPVFKSQLPNIVEHWALLPTRSNELFLYRKRNMLPIAEDHDGSMYSHVMKVLVTLGMPILNTNIVEGRLSLCPLISDHSAILHNLLWLHKDCDISSKVMEQDLDTLLTYFQTINFRSTMDLDCILQLPLCQNVEGYLSTLKDKRIFLWPDKACYTGVSKWLNKIYDKNVFIFKDWKWTAFFRSICAISELSSEEFYLKYMFQYIHFLDEDERYQQLQFIRDHVYSSTSSAFKVQLAALPCIGSSNELKCVSDYYDPRKSIFSVFPCKYSRLPSAFCNPQWLEFFSLLGLRTAPTKEEFINFCNTVASGRCTNIYEVSSELLKCVFDEKEWHDDTHFLSEVCAIPFVCTAPVPKVSWIADRYQTPSIQFGDRNVGMTTLRGSAPLKHMMTLWTVRPLAKLPSANDRLLEALQVVIHPCIADVTANIHNISKSRFSSLKLFQNFPDSCKAPQQCKELFEVLLENFRHLKSEGSECYSSLANVCCIPVLVSPGQSHFRGHALVKPCQVLMDDSAISFHPYLHVLSDDLSEVSQILFKLGISKSFGLQHVRLVLELVYHNEHSNTGSSCSLSDPNTCDVVQKAITKLYSLLIQQESPDVTVAALKPLYLTTREGRLCDTSLLFYQDRPVYKSPSLNGTNFSFIKLPDSCRISEVQLMNLLPAEIQPRAISKHCIERLGGRSNVIPGTQAANNLHTTLTSALFGTAVCSIVRHFAAAKDDLFGTFSVVLQHLQGNMTVQEADPLCVRILFGLNDDSEKEEIGCVSSTALVEDSNGSLNIYLKPNMSSFEVDLSYKEIASRLIAIISSVVQLDKSTVDAVVDAIPLLIKIENIQHMREYFMATGIKFDETTALHNNMDVPKLGAPIPVQLIPHINQDSNNIYHPEEWVAYEKEEEVFVFARIQCPILENVPEYELPSKYIIWTSSEDTKEVSFLYLYKIMKSPVSPPFQASVCKELDLFDDDHKPMTKKSRIDVDGTKKALCDELRKIWLLGNEERRKAVKRLFLKWHPDKNIEYADLTEVIFKFLKRQIELLEKGQPLDDETSQGSSHQRSSGFSPSNEWSSSFHAWSDFARRYYWTGARQGADPSQEGHRPNSSCPQWSSDTARASTGNQADSSSFFSFVYTQSSAGNVREGKRWLSQAEADYQALLALYQDTGAHPDVCCNVCFMAHEVAEKALKAGRYATCGLSGNHLKHHELIHHAYALMSVRQEATRGLDQLVKPLEPYYLFTRFPNKYEGDIVPKDMYNRQHALDAKITASKILQIIQSIVNSK